jgi:membrane protein implicated in regulation of membrane protease activity
MNAEAIFLSCFVFGLVFTAGSFFGGMGHFHLGHIPLGHHGAHNRGGHWLNGFTIAAFLCWFGGIGYLLQRTHTFALAVVVLLSLSAGFTAAALISAFLTKVLMKHERPLVPEDTEMRGVLARVSNRVRPGGTGEIVFSLNGTRRCAAARSQTETTLPRGTEVVVTSYSRGIAWIAPFHATAEAEPWQQHLA